PAAEVPQRTNVFDVLACGRSEHLANRLGIHVIEGAQPKRHRAATAIAIRLWPEDALFFLVAADVERKHLRSRETIVGHRAAVFRAQQLERMSGALNQLGVLLLDYQQPVDDAIAFFVIQPERVGFGLAFHVSVKFENNSGGERLVLPFFNKLLQLPFVFARQDGGNSDPKSTLSRIANRALDSLISPRPAQPIVTRFHAIDRNFEIHVRPIRNANSAVRDDHVAPKIARTHLDNFLAHQRLAADPTAREERKTFRLKLVKKLPPSLYRKVLRLFVLEEIAVMASQVTLVRYIDRADRVLRNAH